MTKADDGFRVLRRGGLGGGGSAGRQQTHGVSRTDALGLPARSQPGDQTLCWAFTARHLQRLLEETFRGRWRRRDDEPGHQRQNSGELLVEERYAHSSSDISFPG